VTRAASRAWRWRATSGPWAEGQASGIQRHALDVAAPDDADEAIGRLSDVPEHLGRGWPTPVALTDAPGPGERAREPNETVNRAWRHHGSARGSPDARRRLPGIAFSEERGIFRIAPSVAAGRRPAKRRP
jgi:hypothetical protein